MEGLTSNINTFVRLFSSINNLFCHLRWLERNIRNSSFILLLIVGLILIFALFFMNENQHFFDLLGFPSGTDKFIRLYGPFLIVLCIIGLFLYKRSISGSQPGNIDSVLYGNDDRNDENNYLIPTPTPTTSNNENQKIYYGKPISSSQMNRKVMV